MLSRKEKKVYGDTLRDFRPTIKTLLIQILEQKLFNLRRQKQSIYNEGSVFIPETDRLKYVPLRYVALISNGKVAEVIRLNSEAADILLAKNIKMVEFDHTTVMVKKGMKYSGKKFVEDADDKED